MAGGCTFYPMTLEELREAVEDGKIDTVLLAITDMQGRLQGKRLVAPVLRREVAKHGARAATTYSPWTSR